MNISLRENGKFGLFYFNYFVMFCLFAAFLTTFLKSIGYSDIACGWIMTMVSVLNILLQPIFGYIADTYISIRKIIIGAMVVSGPFALGMYWFRETLWIEVICVAVVSICIKTMQGVIDSWVMRSRTDKPYLNYGLVRGIGSLSYALTAILFGWIVDQVGYFYMFLAIGIFAVLAIISALCIADVPCANRHEKRQKKQKAAGEKNSGGLVETIKILLTDKRYMIFIISATLLNIGITSASSFSQLLVLKYGGTNAHVGILMFVQAIVEVPMMFLYSRFANRFRMGVLVFVSYIGGIFRAGALGFANSLTMVLIAPVFQSISYGLYMPATVDYINRISPANIRSTAITIAIAVQNGLSSVISSIMSGYVSEYLGINMVFIIGMVLAIIASGIFMMTFFLKDQFNVKKAGHIL